MISPQPPVNERPSFSQAELDLTFSQRAELMRLVMELREPRPIGVVGLKESRDLFSLLFPAFAEVRDAELDKALDSIATVQSSDPKPPEKNSL